MALIGARVLARLLALILTMALAIAGLAVAVFSVQGDSSTLSLPSLAHRVRLDALRADVGAWLAHLQADGPIAKIAALAGAATVILGLVLLFGVLGRRRERLVVIRSDDDGRIAARPRVLGQAAVMLAQRHRHVVHVKARTRARRRGVGGRLRLTVHHARPTDEVDVVGATRDRVRPLAESFTLRLRIGAHAAGRRGARVS